MAVHTSPVKLTYEDYVLLPDDGNRHELLDGEHVMTPSPNTTHQRISRNLVAAFLKELNRHPVGEVFYAPYDVVLSEFDVCEPDVVFVAQDQMSIITEANIQGAPALVVEILSEGTRKRDERVKRGLYERHGVREYWIVDPQLELVKIYQLRDGRYGKAQELTLEAQDTVTTPLLPGLTLPLTDVFA